MHSSTLAQQAFIFIDSLSQQYTWIFKKIVQEYIDVTNLQNCFLWNVFYYNLRNNGLVTYIGTAVYTLFLHRPSYPIMRVTCIRSLEMVTGKFEPLPGK